MPISSLTAIDRESLNQSLLIETVKLFALAAGADQVVTDSESAYVRQYLARTYPPEFTEFLHGEFLRLAGEDLDPDRIAINSKAQLSYEERIFMLGKLLELLAIDEVTQEEVTFWHDMGSKMEVPDTDLTLLRSLLLNAEAQPDRRSPNLRWLRLTGYGEGGDVELPTPGLRLLVMRVNRQVFLRQMDLQQAVYTRQNLLAPHQLTRMVRGEPIFFGSSLKVLPGDLKYFFRQIDLPPEQVTLCLDHRGFTLGEIDAPEALVRLHLDRGRIQVEPLKAEPKLYLDDKVITGPTPVNLSDSIRSGFYRFYLRDKLLHEPGSPTILRVNGHKDTFFIGNQFECDVLIDDDLETPWQCRIETTSQGYYLRPSGCPYPIWINEKRIRGSQYLDLQDRIRVRNTLITWDEASEFFEVQDSSLQRVEGKNLRFAFPDGTVAVDDVSFEVQRGELTGLLGPSGSGKSTLLNLINGFMSPESGQVLIDDYDLHVNFQRFRDRMGYVPQDDLLFENLTVFENLYFNARLRYPDGTNDLTALVHSVLRDIGLYEKRNLRVGNPENKVLSGGQRKRLNIGLELLGDYDLLLLDEPTSGLSSKDSERLLRLIRELASRGKMVFVVIHQPSSRLYAMFDKMIVLDRGGRLAFFGRAVEAIDYFQQYSSEATPQLEVKEVEIAPELILDTIEQPLRDIDGTPLNIRRYAPAFWQERYHEAQGRYLTRKPDEVEDHNEPPLLPWRQPRNVRERFAVFQTLLQRNFLHKLRDRSNLLVTFLIPPLLALLVGLILRYQDAEAYTLFNNLHLSTFLFLAVLIAIFLGVTNSVEEIIRDQRILIRERMLDVSRLSYYISKFLTMSTFSLVQTFLFLAVGFLTLGMRELFWAHWAILWLTAMCGVGLGLFVSSLPGLSAKGAVNLVPILLIPQIIFGGALVEYRKMNQQLTVLENSPIPELCQVMVSRWAFESMVTLQGYHNRYHPEEDRQLYALNDYRRFQREDILAHLTDSLGDASAAQQLYDTRKKEMEQRLEAFRQQYRDRYGNRMLNQAVVSASKDYERQVSEGGSQVYPLFVPHKQIAFTSITLPTPAYNILVMLGVLSALILAGLLMLYRRF
jgi:ABC-type multidrug transport system ATPase subunit/ABC-type multidrug transport system permease subunit